MAEHAGRSLAAVLASFAFACTPSPPPEPTTAASSAAVPVDIAPTAAPVAVAILDPRRFVDRVDATSFLRGNLHTHSRESDGDSTPDRVYKWYRDHDYAFLALTDHNKRTDPAKYASIARSGFVMVPAEEVTMAAGKIPVHVNAICHRARIGGAAFAGVEEALAWAVSRIHEEGGVALVNHPNFHWAFGAKQLGAARDAELLEVWSGHPSVHTLGDATHPSHEAIWSAALAAGLDFAPAAVDDMHTLGAPPESRSEIAAPVRGSGKKHAGPGRGWVDVLTNDATVEGICDALKRRAVVASTGPRLSRLVVDGDAMTLEQATPSGAVEFVGEAGAVLEKQPAARENVYRLRGDEALVRARVLASDGSELWTRAYRTAPSK